MRAVLNTLTVIEALGSAKTAGVSELARSTGIPKSTVQRCLLAAADAGWVRPTGSGEATRWTIAPRALRVCAGGVERDLRDAARDALVGLRDATGEAVHLVTRDGDHVVLLERLPGSGPVQVVIPIGFRVPIHAGATGKAILAALDDDEIDRLLPTDLDRLTEHTTSSRSALHAELDEVRRRGFAENAGDWDTSVAAVAAAIVGPDGVVGALSVSSTPERLDADRRRAVAPLVMSAAADVSARL